MFVGTLSLSLLYLFDNESCGNAKYRLLWRVPFSNYRWYEYTKVQGRLGSDKAESRSWSENIIFIYDDAPAHHSLADPGQNTELNKLPSYSPFLNIVGKSISELKAAIKADIIAAQKCNNKWTIVTEEARRNWGTEASSNSAPATSVTAKCRHNNPSWMRAVVPFYAEIPAPLSKQRAKWKINNSVIFFFYFVTDCAQSFPSCNDCSLLVNAVSHHVIACLCTLNKQSIHIIVCVNAPMNFRDYGNCTNECPCSTIHCP